MTRVELLRLLARGVRVVGQRRVDLDRDISAQAPAPVPHRSHEVARPAHVLRGELEERLARLAALRAEPSQLLVVPRALGHRLLEDRRVRRDAADSVVAHHPLELPRLQEIAGEEVDPHALSERRQLMQARVGHVASYVTPMAETERWRELGQQLRVDSIRPSAIAGSGHPTSGMSAADLMAVLVDGHLRYDWANPKAATNDRLVFSKGHASTLLYGILRAAGVISEEDFDGYRTFGSSLEGHPTPVLPWVDVATGLARPRAADRRRHGASPGRHLDRLPYRVWVLCGDSRARRGLDVGGVRARVALRARQPHGDRRRQPPRASAARRWSAGTPACSPSARARSAGTRSRSTATTSSRSTRRTRTPRR